MNMTLERFNFDFRMFRGTISDNYYHRETYITRETEGDGTVITCHIVNANRKLVY